MELSPWTLYFIFQLDSFNHALAWVFSISIITFIALWIFYGFQFPITSKSEQDRVDNFKKNQPWKGPLVVATVLLFLGALLPSTKTALMIWGIPQVVNNEQVQQLPDKFIRLLNSYLDEYTLDTETEQ